MNIKELLLDISNIDGETLDPNGMGIWTLLSGHGAVVITHHRQDHDFYKAAPQ